MAMWLTYQMFSKAPELNRAARRSDTTKEIEIFDLRHQLAVLQRRTPRPRMSWVDRAFDPRPRAATSSPPPRADRHAIHDPALAPTDHRPTLDHPTRPAWPTRHPGRRARPGPPPGHRAPPGATGASTASSPDSAIRSGLRPSGRSWTASASTPHPAAPDPRGPNSCQRKHTASSPAVCFTSTP